MFSSKKRPGSWDLVVCITSICRLMLASRLVKLTSCQLRSFSVNPRALAISFSPAPRLMWTCGRKATGGSARKSRSHFYPGRRWRKRGGYCVLAVTANGFRTYARYKCILVSFFPLDFFHEEERPVVSPRALVSGRRAGVFYALPCKPSNQLGSQIVIQRGAAQCA